MTASRSGRVGYAMLLAVLPRDLRSNRGPREMECPGTVYLADSLPIRPRKLMPMTAVY